MKPENINDIQTSFTIQAKNFEDSNMNFSKQEYLDYIVHSIEPSSSDYVLEAAGTCVCGRSVASLVQSVICLDATPAMLEIGQKEAEKVELIIWSLLMVLLKKFRFLMDILILY
ncbi:MAG: hypothetical protein GX957_09380 [Clostridiaceae bacterium]|nr:hypothetical protein [Clostridiaceae bacterium]